MIADNNYTYNAAGQITQNLDQSGTHVYGYDAPDRLTSATYTGTPAESYAYDAVGNRTSSHRSATYNYQPFNRLTSTSTATYLYNNNGNMISKSDASGTTQFAWDFENRLVQVVTPSAGSASYKYDALGRRIQRTPSSGISTNFVYDGQDVVKDINSDGSTVEYLNGPGIDNKIRQKGSSTSTTYYFSQDHLGSPTALTGTTGKLVERITYDAYGNSAGSTRTRYGFTGRERDLLTGLLYYRARFYDPQLGRFISEDPIGLAGGINSFAYVGNNPVLYRDPSGLCPQDTGQGLNPVEGEKRWNDCMNRYLPEAYPGGRNKPTGQAVGAANLASGESTNESALLLAIIAKESGFSPAPTGDHGPMELTSWISNYAKNHNLDIVVPGSYDPFPRVGKNRNRTFTGDYDANVQTGENWIRYQRDSLKMSDWQIAHGYGPGPTTAIRTAYANEAISLRDRYAPFVNCLKTGQ